MSVSYVLQLLHIIKTFSLIIHVMLGFLFLYALLKMHLVCIALNIDQIHCKGVTICNISKSYILSNNLRFLSFVCNHYMCNHKKNSKNSLNSGMKSDILSRRLWVLVPNFPHNTAWNDLPLPCSQLPVGP